MEKKTRKTRAEQMLEIYMADIYPDLSALKADVEALKEIVIMLQHKLTGENKQMLDAEFRVLSLNYQTEASSVPLEVVKKELREKLKLFYQQPD